jgi:hypothetical protein
MNLKAFLIFHLNVGARLALNKLVPVLGAIFAVYFIFKPEFFNEYFSVLLSEGSLIPGVLFTLLCAATASMASKRVCLGLSGWMRHLPASGLTIRRLAEIAIFAAQTPILLVLLFFPCFSVFSHGVSPYSFAFITGVPLLGYASAKASIPSRRSSVSKTLAYAACILLVSGRWVFLLGGAVLLFITDLISGPLSAPRKRRLFRSSSRGYFLNAVIIWRAVKFRILIPYVLGAAVLGAMMLFLSNNQFSPEVTLKVMTLGGALSAVSFLAFFSNYLASRRPAWPWIRSLPGSARDRVLLDFLCLFLLVLPVLVFLFFINERALLFVAAFLPAVCVWSCLSIRKGGNLKMGASGSILCFGFISSLLITLIPLSSVAFLIGLPFLMKGAVESERNLKVSRWLKLHHLAAGDTLSWSKE